MPEAWLRTPAQGRCRARLVLAHGAGAPMDSDLLNDLSEALAAQAIEVWRFEFPYMAERRRTGGRRPPNPLPELLASWQTHLAQALSPAPPVPVLIGGKSLGGRVASLLAVEQAPLAGVQGLVCLGYPFHPPGKPERLRTAHLAQLSLPTLIVQGTRDPLGNRDEVAGYPLAPAVQLHWLEDGDHDFKPRVKSGFHHRQHLLGAAQAVADFIARLTSRP